MAIIRSASPSKQKPTSAPVSVRDLGLLREERPTLVINIRAIWISRMHDDLRAKLLEEPRGHWRRGHWHNQAPPAIRPASPQGQAWSPAKVRYSVSASAAVRMQPMSRPVGAGRVVPWRTICSRSSSCASGA